MSQLPPAPSIPGPIRATAISGGAGFPLTAANGVPLTGNYEHQDLLKLSSFVFVPRWLRPTVAQLRPTEA